MNITRYTTPRFLTSPAFGEVSRLTDLLDAAFSFPFSFRNRSREWFPPVEVLEEDGTLTVHLEAVGLKKDDFEISLQDKVLTISHECSQANIEKTPVSRQSFSRSLTLPAAVDPAKVEAVYQDGVLTITLPKAEEEKPRKIEIRSK